MIFFFKKKSLRSNVYAETALASFLLQNFLHSLLISPPKAYYLTLGCAKSHVSKLPDSLQTIVSKDMV